MAGKQGNSARGHIFFVPSRSPVQRDMSAKDPEEKVYAWEICGHCEGERCTYCDKQGYVMVAQPAKKCRHCEGDGCIYCGYTGWTDVLRASDPRCREACHKSGTE
jgi:hypothetical protein